MESKVCLELNFGGFHSRICVIRLWIGFSEGSQKAWI